MRKTVRLTFRDGLRAQYLKFRGHLLLSGRTEAGEEAEVGVPLRAMSAVMDAIEAASLGGTVRVEDLPASGVLDVGEIRVGLVPKAGLAMRLTLVDGRETLVLIRSCEGEAVLRRAGEQIRDALTLVVRGAPNRRPDAERMSSGSRDAGKNRLGPGRFAGRETPMVDDQDPPPGGSKLARATKRVPEPYERDAEGKPVQPQDRPPARPHMTVTREPEPSPHEVKDKMGQDG